MDSGREARRPDSELVYASSLGDKDAFAELIGRRWVAAVSLAARVLGSADLGHDAAQEAAIAAMSGLDQLRSADRFGAWFCGITLNVARRWLRQMRAERWAHVTEVRITRLTDATYYAAIMIEGSVGSQEVDARPSDAVNLALVTGAAIRVDSALLDNPGDTGPQWRDLPLGTTEVARQATQLMEQRRAGQNLALTARSAAHADVVALRRGPRQHAPLWWTDGVGQAVPSHLRLRRT